MEYQKLIQGKEDQKDMEANSNSMINQLGGKQMNFTFR
jgi:hypothetical protein